MVNFRVSVRGFIVDERDHLLVLKRETNDVHMPGIWEIPGGRLDLGEDPHEGLAREIKEETGLEIDIQDPLTVRHLTRQDGQIVTMLIFLCSPKHTEVNISSEHEAFKWIDLNKTDEAIVGYLGHDRFFMKEVERYKQLFKK